MRIAFVLVTLIVATSTVAEAQLYPPAGNSLEINVLCDVTAPTLITVDITISETFQGSVSQIRIRRGQVGDCSPAIEIDRTVTEPLTVGVYSFQFTDPTPVSGYPFKYYVSLYDAEGNQQREYALFELWQTLDIASCGNTVIGQGYLRSRGSTSDEEFMRSDQDSPVLDPCPDSCWTGFYVGNQDDPIVQVLLDSGNPALLTGDIVCGGFFQGCYLYITGAYNVPCTKIVPAETHSWGALKSRY